MVLAERTKLRVSKNFFSGDIFFVFVEYLCNRSPKIKTKNIKNYSSILAIVNHWNWLDDSPPLSCWKLMVKCSNMAVTTLVGAQTLTFIIAWGANFFSVFLHQNDLFTSTVLAFRKFVFRCVPLCLNWCPK